MSAKELREEFSRLHAKLNRVLKALDKLGVNVSAQGVTTTPSGELTHIKGTGTLGERPLTKAQQQALDLLDLRDELDELDDETNQGGNSE